MTASEACALTLDLARQLAEARSESASYRLLAKQAIHYAAEVVRDRVRVRARYHRLLDEHRAARRTAA